MKFGAVPLAQIRRGHGRGLDIGQGRGGARGRGLAALGQFGALLPDTPRPLMALALAGLSLFPAIAAWMETRHGEAATASRTVHLEKGELVPA